MSDVFEDFEPLINSTSSRFSIYLRPVSYWVIPNHLLYLPRCFSQKLLISIAFKV